MPPGGWPDLPAGERASYELTLGRLMATVCICNDELVIQEQWVAKPPTPEECTPEEWIDCDRTFQVEN